ncbi:ABC transporter F family member 3-like [Dioscorea cayenensis subsp. rotundata]|uniref:ABC transporter F family member 3-like n=1 Tax=Dioscorea cayennensis subsp. rotundata TaxID=55577 RepID=A0AB40B8V5_DIOCR|nr:ABC transporter F family member 3-like [Dioscorea cayenensis subsp. rotundata]
MQSLSTFQGLSFSPEMQKKPTKYFSGGWHMRIALARASFVELDLLLLDEPTNHLDLHGVLWLESYLVKWPKAFIVVSHARKFLNTVITDILHLHNQKLIVYKEDYYTFERTREQQLRNQQKAFETSEKARAHINEYHLGVPEQKLRAHLGSFGVSGNLALQPMYTLSGGQKSRVAFSKITFKKPHIILLDEPSNHLDLDAVEALIQGLVVFQGGVLMVSHDEHLISSSICSMTQNSLQSYILELLLKSLCLPCLCFKMDNKIIQTCHSTSM